MKRLLVYFSVLVGCLFIGLTTYYMLKNYETIIVTGAESENIYLNKGETTDIKIIHEKKNDGTVVTATFDKEGVATYSLETGVLTAVGGGSATLIISSNNENLPVFKYNIEVGDGKASPWFVKTEEDLRSIGTKTDADGNVVWKLSDNYKLFNNIELNGEWTPIGGYTTQTVDDKEIETLEYFSGVFDGANHTISNLQITHDNYNAGLFGAIGNFGQVSNLTIKNAKLTGYFYYAGVLAGINDGSNIERVSVENAEIKLQNNVDLKLLTSGSSKLDLNHVGGLVGISRARQEEDRNSFATITLTSFDGKITIAPNAETISTQYVVGGLVGYSLGSEVINNKVQVNYVLSDSILKITAEKSNNIFVGGLVGVTYFHDSNRSEFAVGENGKASQLAYAITKNNLVFISTNDVSYNMGGITGKLPGVPTTEEGMKAFLAGRGIAYEESAIQDYINEAVEINSIISSRYEGNIYNYIGTKELTSTLAGEVNKTVNELKDINTYVAQGWLISSVENSSEELKPWIIADGIDYANINVDGAKETTEYSKNIIEINSVEDFVKYVEKMLDNTSTSVQRYYLTRHYVLNCDVDLSQIATLKTWTPISYRNSDFAFAGIFDGNGHTISNLNIQSLDNKEVKYQVVGLFATIGNQGVVKNLKLETVNIDYANIGGAVAGVNNGQIENCQVEAITIKNAAVAGFVVGINNGLILNNKKAEGEDVLQYTVLENTAGENSIVSEVKDKHIYLGGVAGFNAGEINGIKIQSNFSIIGATNINYSYLEMIGGIAGYNDKDAKIVSSSVENANLKNYSTNYLYMGGIAGLSNGLISKCHAGSKQGGLSLSIVAETKKGDQVVGGIVGQLSIGAEITQSFVNGDISSYMVGGIGSLIFGNVSECYVLGSLEGEYVGGLSVQLSLSDTQKQAGYIQDCYVKATLKGTTENSKVAGVATYVVKPGKVENCIIMATFAGKGAKYYESYTDTRTWLYNSINSFAGTKLGTINNIVIDESLNQMEVKKNGGLINNGKQNVYYVNQETIKSGKEFYSEKGFNTNEIWNFESQKYPVLTNTDIDGISQILKIEDGVYKADTNTEENSVTLELIAGSQFKLTKVVESNQTIIEGKFINDSSIIKLIYNEEVVNEETLAPENVEKTIECTYSNEVETSITITIDEKEYVLVLAVASSDETPVETPVETPAETETAEENVA